jgi:hypothetical protein
MAEFAGQMQWCIADLLEHCIVRCGLQSLEADKPVFASKSGLRMEKRILANVRYGVRVDHEKGNGFLAL